jgi:hypothetical protein
MYAHMDKQIFKKRERQGPRKQREGSGEGQALWHCAIT